MYFKKRHILYEKRQLKILFYLFSSMNLIEWASCQSGWACTPGPPRGPPLRAWSVFEYGLWVVYCSPGLDMADGWCNVPYG